MLLYESWADALFLQNTVHVETNAENEVETKTSFEKLEGDHTMWHEQFMKDLNVDG
jgi:hypothetical protein